MRRNCTTVRMLYALKMPGPELKIPPRTMRCLQCAYVLNGLENQGVCPECGRGYDLWNHQTFTFRSPVSRWKMMLPGVVAAFILCILALGFLGFISDAWGGAVWLGVPGAVGCLLGYEARIVRYGWPIAALLAVGIVITVMVSMGLGGAFCGLVLMIVALVPAGFGAVVGGLLRTIINERWYTLQRPMLLLVLLLGLCIWGVIEGPATPAAPETVRTEVEIAAAPDRVWNSLMYYEEVTHPPPWILRIGLARPTATEGFSRRIGETKKCLYNKGWITKRVTAVDPNRALRFDVIEQHIGYERDVMLTHGTFELAALEGGKTRLTLSTTYRPLLGPRFAWAPAEHLAVRILHEYVGEGIALKAVEPEAPKQVAR